MSAFGWYVAGLLTPVAFVIVGILWVALTAKSTLLSISCTSCATKPNPSWGIEPYGKRPWWWHDLVRPWLHDQTRMHRGYPDKP